MTALRYDVRNKEHNNSILSIPFMFIFCSLIFYTTCNPNAYKYVSYMVGGF